MPAIDHLLKRFGFVRIARYGLVLTPEGRIMSLRPAILDDGLGGRIVGWADGDLAAMELQTWEPARPAPQTAVATRLAVAPPPIPEPVAPPAVKPAPIVAVPAQVEPEVEQDDWEWEIALARARVAAEESEQAAASVRMPSPRARLETLPPPATQLVVKIPPIDFEDRTSTSNDIVQAARITTTPAPIAAERPLASPVGVRKVPTVPVATIPAPKTTQVVAIPPIAPPTIIPIPKLPSIKDRSSQIQPVVSAAPTRPSRTRLAKGTGPVGNTQVGVAPPPMIRAGEDDKTSPQITLPVAARSVTLPSIKRASR